MSELSARLEGEMKASRMAGWTGLEPAASGVTGRRSNQLNYHPKGNSLRSVSTFALRASVDNLRPARQP